MNISAVSEKDSEVLALINKTALPIHDISDNVELFAIKENEQVVGTIGMERNERFALLRSLSEKQRGKGYGDTLVRFLEDKAKQKRIETIYLLTTTAEAFFSKKGYVTIQRSDVPEFIRLTSEFSSTCPSTAIVMKKDLQ